MSISGIILLFCCIAGTSCSSINAVAFINNLSIFQELSNLEEKEWKSLVLTFPSKRFSHPLLHGLPHDSLRGLLHGLLYVFPYGALRGPLHGRHHHAVRLMH